jgi:hypothetical protein
VKAVDRGCPTVWHLPETDNFLQHEDVVTKGDDRILAQHSKNPTKKINNLEKAIMVKETKNLMKAKKLEHIAKISQVLHLVQQSALVGAWAV